MRMQKRELAMRMRTSELAIDAMRSDRFHLISECDANAKMDSHYQPCEWVGQSDQNAPPPPPQMYLNKALI
jgi:hypothetical protein